MQQLTPNEIFPIVRILIDTTDSTLYYPQAVVKDSKTSETLATVNLAFVSTRYYMTTYTVPNDTVFGQGRHINITTTIYTDSNHTTKSEAYYDEVQQYVIQQRWNPSAYMGGNSEAKGGADIDYKKLREIIVEELKKLKFPEQIQAKDFPTKVIVDSIVAKIDKIPVPEKVILTNLEDAILSLNLTLDALPKFKETDMSPVARATNQLRADMLAMHKEYMATMDEYMDKMLETAKMKFINNVKNGTVDFSVTDDEEMALKKKRKKYLNSLMSKYA